MNQHVTFLKESFRNLRTTGSVMRSSRWLCRRLVSEVDPKAKVVVELGAGDGVITQYLLEHLGPEAHLLVFEINPVFVQKLEARFDDPRLALVHDSAERLGFHLSDREIEQVDYVVSAIPFAVLPESLAEQIIDECYAWLRPGGRFIQFHYSPHLAGLYQSKFRMVEQQFIPWNLPPAFIFSCEK